jgi:hypothetical protein
VVSSRDADGLFRRVLREVGVPPVHRRLMWTGVRWGALANPLRQPRWARDAPRVLALSVLAAPLVVPPAAVIAAALAATPGAGIAASTSAADQLSALPAFQSSQEMAQS